MEEEPVAGEEPMPSCPARMSSMLVQLMLMQQHTDSSSSAALSVLCEHLNVKVVQLVVFGRANTYSMKEMVDEVCAESAGATADVASLDALLADSRQPLVGTVDDSASNVGDLPADWQALVAEHALRSLRAIPIRSTASTSRRLLGCLTVGMRSAGAPWWQQCGMQVIHDWAASVLESERRAACIDFFDELQASTSLDGLASAFVNGLHACLGRGSHVHVALVSSHATRGLVFVPELHAELHAQPRTCTDPGPGMDTQLCRVASAQASDSSPQQFAMISQMVERPTWEAEEPSGSSAVAVDAGAPAALSTARVHVPTRGTLMMSAMEAGHVMVVKNTLKYLGPRQVKPPDLDMEGHSPPLGPLLLLPLVHKSRPMGCVYVFCKGTPQGDLQRDYWTRLQERMSREVFLQLSGPLRADWCEALIDRTPNPHPYYPPMIDLVAHAQQQQRQRQQQQQQERQHAAAAAATAAAAAAVAAAAARPRWSSRRPLSAPQPHSRAAAPPPASALAPRSSMSARVWPSAVLLDGINASVTGLRLSVGRVADLDCAQRAIHGSRDSSGSHRSSASQGDGGARKLEGQRRIKEAERVQAQQQEQQQERQQEQETWQSTSGLMLSDIDELDSDLLDDEDDYYTGVLPTQQQLATLCSPELQFWPELIETVGTITRKKGAMLYAARLEGQLVTLKVLQSGSAVDRHTVLSAPHYQLLLQQTALAHPNLLRLLMVYPAVYEAQGGRPNGTRFTCVQAGATRVRRSTALVYEHIPALSLLKALQMSLLDEAAPTMTLRTSAWMSSLFATIPGRRAPARSATASSLSGGTCGSGGGGGAPASVASVASVASHTGRQRGPPSARSSFGAGGAAARGMRVSGAGGGAAAAVLAQTLGRRVPRTISPRSGSMAPRSASFAPQPGLRRPPVKAHTMANVQVCTRHSTYAQYQPAGSVTMLLRKQSSGLSSGLAAAMISETPDTLSGQHAYHGGSTCGRRPLRMPTIVSILSQVASALAALHAARLLHGEVCPRNVLLTTPALLAAQATAPSVSGGGAAWCASDQQELAAAVRALPPCEVQVRLKDAGMCSLVMCNGTVTARKLLGRKRKGLLWYLPAEVLKGQRPRRSTDVYSFGVMMREIFSGSEPQPSAFEPPNSATTMNGTIFGGGMPRSGGSDVSSASYAVVANYDDRSTAAPMPEWYRLLADRCTDTRPSARPSMSAVLAALDAERRRSCLAGITECEGEAGGSGRGQQLRGL
ncbi:hypothetical protein FOA52_008642 [Chlamydomonas sp. UWO 241]|nr:hypothetical protein FOA52_008642 [Chlamydomonas sp. UWO 241]